MGNSASSKKPQSPENSTKDVLNDKISDFERISHPSSPATTVEKSTHVFPVDEMSYSGLLVDKTGSIMMPDDGKADLASSAFFSPAKDGSSSAAVHPNRRRIIKATPPPATATTTTTASSIPRDEDQEIYHGSGKHHLPAVLSPKASSELLNESIEQSKSKRLEQLSREQKSKRDKLLDAKRRGIKTSPDSESSSDEGQGEKKKKETPQPNPFSKFLRVFSVEPEYPHHKRSYEEGSVDQEEAAAAAHKTGTTISSTATSGRHSPSVVVAPHNESKRQKLDDSHHDARTSITEKGRAMLSSVLESMPEWVPMATASAAMAAVAVMFALKVGSMSSGGSNKSY